LSAFFIYGGKKMVNNQESDMDLQGMSEEQLAEFINGNSKQETDQQIPVIDETVQNEAEAKEEAETPTDETVTTEPKQDEDEIEDPYFRGKSRKDMYEIIKQNNAMISRQSNKEHEIMKRLEQLEVLKSKIEQKKEVDEELFYVDEGGKKVPYDKRDIEVIEKLVERKLEYRTKAQQEQEKKQREQNVQDNESFWADLSIYNPVLKADIQEKVLSEIQKNRTATLENKGWLKSFVASQSQARQPVTAPVLDKQKKLKATTVTSGSMSKPVIKKSVDQMDADEYLNYMASQGIKIPRA
jgi:hypothetical protein